MKHAFLGLALAMSFFAPELSAQGQTSSTTALPPASVVKQMALQGGPGIVISGSAQFNELPAQAQKFLSEDYSADQPTSITRNFLRQTYHVVLADGTKVTFDKDGLVTNIQAPADMVLPMEVLADILPQKTSIHLAEVGLIGDVSEVKNASGKGTLVMMLHTTPPRMLFDFDGNFVVVYD